MLIVFSAFAADSSGASFITPLVDAVQPWQSLYSDHKLVSTSVLFVHLAALVASAGLAVSADRAVVRTTAGDSAEQMRRLRELSLTHRPVVFALAVSFLSGVLLLLADLEAFFKMPAFWAKMSLISLLVINALLMMRRERRIGALADAASAAETQKVAQLWSGLRRHAYASLGLWFAIVLAGTAMTSG